MRLTKRKICSKNPDLPKIKSLYDSSFDSANYPSFGRLKLRAKKENVSFESYYVDGNFFGLACIIFNDDAVYIQCIAIAHRYRSKGLGSLVVSDITNRAEGRAVFTEVERCDDGNSAKQNELKTLDFFAKNGFCDTGFSVRRKQKIYSVISNGNSIDSDNFFKICNGYSMGFYSPEIIINR